LALASLSRVSEVLELNTNLEIIEDEKTHNSNAVLEFRDVGFYYVEGKNILNNINFSLEK
jgi:ATP-binding cassette, subfamily B, bacterial